MHRISQMFCRWAAACACLLFAAAAPAADVFPTKPITLLVGFAAGGGSDFIARAMADGLGKQLVQPIIVDNRPGGGGSVAARAVASAPPDGYTLLLGSAAAFVINPILMKSLPYDPVADFAPVGGVARFSYVLLARNDLPVKNVAELLQYARANPGKLSIGSAGNGSNTHLAAAAFQTATGVQMLHVPYKGTTPALTDLMGGSIDVLFDSVPTVLGQIRGGKLRALATSGTQREPLLPNLPTVEEGGVKGFSATNWFALFAPKGISPEVIGKINQGLNKALAGDKLKTQFSESGNTPLPGSAADLAKLIANETASYKRLIQATSIHLD